MRLALALLLCATASAQDLTTTAEKTHYQRTGRYEEVQSLAQRFQARWPQYVKLETFGTTPEGRPMLAIVATQKPEKTPVILIQGGIHAGEIDGKDAGFEALRELLEKPGPLQHCTLVFVPVFNVDGHERFARYNRPNQNGPEEMGWRVTSQNLNLNRDYAKADAPEMQAMIRLLNKWDPILYVDLHVTDGAQFQVDVANLFEPVFTGAPKLQPLARELSRDLNAHLQSQGVKAVDFYPSFVDYSKPESGFAQSAYPPRFSTGYWPLSNRFALLVETHSWKPYPERVKVTRAIILHLVETIAKTGSQLQQAAQQEDRQDLTGTSVPLSYKNTARTEQIDFPGYAYTREKSAISNGEWLRYDPQKPTNWSVPFLPEVTPALTTTAPQAYFVPAWLQPKLDLHGIKYTLQPKPENKQVEVFRADRIDFSRRPFEGRQTATVTGSWKTETQTIPGGTLTVPVNQPKARLLIALLEPQAPDSYLAWGEFNAHFEQKEYMEDYVAEEVAREMLKKDPALQQEFQKKLAEDPEFARDPHARLDFFYRRHPSWDTRFNLYPVMRGSL